MDNFVGVYSTPLEPPTSRTFFVKLHPETAENCRLQTTDVGAWRVNSIFHNTSDIYYTTRESRNETS